MGVVTLAFRWVVRFGLDSAYFHTYVMRMQHDEPVTPQTLTDDMLDGERRWLHDAKKARGIPSESQMRYERDLFIARDLRFKEVKRDAARQRVCNVINARRGKERT